VWYKINQNINHYYILLRPKYIIYMVVSNMV